VPELSIRLLGRPELTCRDEPVVIERRKTLALIAYLAVTEKPSTRGVLTELLWPEAPAGRASAYLRNALWLIKQTPVSPWLETPGDRVRLRHDPDCRVDVIAFRRCIRAGRGPMPEDVSRPWAGAAELEQAAALYRGDFMTGFLIDESAGFEDWQLRQEDALRRDLAEALARLVAYHEARRNTPAALEHAQRWLALDPLDENAQGRLMLLYARAGQRAAALHLFERSEQLLRDELGALPGARLLRLRQRILAGDPLAPAPREPATRAPGLRPRVPLPKPPASFVGREQEVAEIGRILAGDACRILALVGPGGVGKTRLALQAAHIHGGAFVDRAAFVPLANVMSAEQVLPAVLAALRIPTSTQTGGSRTGGLAGRHAAIDRLLEFLRGKRLLLLLDNVEHVIAGIEWLADLGATAPHVRVLLTSRVRPGMDDAWVLEVRGLACPGSAADATDGRDCDAVRLFLDHARRARVGFEPDAADLAAIVEICRMLDGLPLGIELAAAWARTLSCRELAAEIRRSVDFLKDSPAQVPERHRGLGIVFAQSWARLTHEDQQRFQSLSLFRGGFTRRSAEEIAACTAPALTTLLDASLLRRTASERYEMLEVIRQYAEERLRESPGACAEVRERFARHFLELLTGRRADLQGERVTEALAELAADADNLREAWTAALAPPRLDWLAASLIPYFVLHDILGRWVEGAQRFHDARLALADARDPQGRLVLGFALVAEGWFMRERDWNRAIELIRAGAEILDALEPSPESAYAGTLAAVEIAVEDRAEAERRVRRTCAQLEALGDRWGLGLALEILAHVVEGDAQREQFIQRSLALRREIGDRWGTALSYHAAALVASARGEYERARELLTRSLALRRELDIDPFGTAMCLLDLGWASLDEGAERDAERRFTESLALAEAHGMRYSIVAAARGLGATALQGERIDDAREHFERALSQSEPFAGKCSQAELHGLLANLDVTAAQYADARDRIATARALDAADPWAALASLRLVLAQGDANETRERLCEILGVIGREAGSPRFTIECLLEAAVWLSRGQAAEEAFVVCGWLLRQPAAGPAKRTRISRLLRRAAGAVPRARRSPALAEGRELTRRELIARVLLSARRASPRD
jgi:DNA-binding SARP family transcriptional activator/predicted ATPase